MKKHHGMRPQDVVVLLKIASTEASDWRNVDLAAALHISPSEVSESLNRNRLAGLVDASKRRVHRHALYEFLVYGLRYVFPVQPGPLVRGMATAHSAPPISQYIASGTDIYVWPCENGTLRGQSIEPLYHTVPESVANDTIFYELLTLTDALRVGKARERKLAMEELGRRLGYDGTEQDE